MKKYSVFFLFLLFLLSGKTEAQDPLKQLRSGVIEKTDGQEYYIHLVKKGQTLYMISKAYGVEVNDVIKENPEVKEGLKADMKLRIPVPHAEEVQKKTGKHSGEAHREKEKEVVAPVPETPPAETSVPCGEGKSFRNKNYNVALMLPLFLDEVVPMDVMAVPADPETAYQPLKFIQFYEGMLIALDSLAKQGLKVKVFVYDADKDTLKTKKLLREPEMKNMDLIIGLLYPRNFQIVAEFAQKNGINIVNPLSEREQLVKGNPRVFKIRPSGSSLQENLVSFLSANYKEGRIIIVSPPLYPDKEAPLNLKKQCLTGKMDAMIVDSYTAAVEQFSKEQDNVLVIYSENEAAALDIITKLNEKRTDGNLTVIGVPRWDRFDEIESDYLVNLKAHFFAPFFVDTEDPDVRNFILKYQVRYKAVPDDLAFQGFDVAYYFLTALHQNGKNFERCIPDLKMKSLQTSFKFSQANGDGYENQYWSLYKYDNFKLAGVAH